MSDYEDVSSEMRPRVVLIYFTDFWSTVALPS
jgi:hypothetical protein